MHAQVRTVLDNVRNHIVAESLTVQDAIDVRATVFVIDDDISVRESLETLIRTTGLEAESFASAEDFLAYSRGKSPCCLIVDVRLPGLSGLDLQRRLAGRLDIPIIFLSGCTDVPKTVQAMKGGAVEFLMKPFRTDLLLKAIHDAIERSRTAARLHSELRALTKCYELLTPRERDVMALVVSGLLNKQIGYELGISEITVKAHRGQVMRKMNADSLAALVMMSLRLGVLPVSKH
jgi:FixJ family two-component response regulator